MVGAVEHEFRIFWARATLPAYPTFPKKNGTMLAPTCADDPRRTDSFEGIMLYASQFST
jgi:hypothetical protein